MTWANTLTGGNVMTWDNTLTQHPFYADSNNSQKHQKSFTKKSKKITEKLKKNH